MNEINEMEVVEDAHTSTQKECLRREVLITPCSFLDTTSASTFESRCPFHRIYVFRRASRLQAGSPRVKRKIMMIIARLLVV